MATTSLGNIILWDRCHNVSVICQNIIMESVTLLSFLPITLKTAVLSWLLIMGKHTVNVLERHCAVPDSRTGIDFHGCQSNMAVIDMDAEQL